MSDFYRLYLYIDYDVEHDAFCYHTNIKQEKIADIVSEFLGTQMGKGADDRAPDIRDYYSIDLILDLSHDIFKVGHTCGNKGLRDGILMNLVSKLG